MNNIRPFGWVIIVINILMISNFFYGISGEDDSTVVGMAFFLTLFLMTVINVPLYVIYRITDKKKRECPACGSKVRVGITTCSKCSYDFKRNSSNGIES
jgi:hypothetical protein